MFLVFEGADAAGKTTQVALLAARLRTRGSPPLVLREPGGTGLGSVVRSLLKDEQGFAIGAYAELLLFAAARAQLLEEIVHPALEDGQTIVCDRYIYSTLAYQGAGRGLPVDIIAEVNRIATSGLLPDIVVLLDLPVAEALSRQSGRANDRFDQESTAFHERVRASYLEQAAADPERWILVDASQPIEAVAAEIWKKVEERC